LSAEDDVVRAADPGEPHTGASAGKLNCALGLAFTDGVGHLFGTAIG
jgi:hypothetical protein